MLSPDAKVSRQPESRSRNPQRKATKRPAAEALWNAIFHTTLARNDIESLSFLAETAGTSLPAILAALNDADEMARLESQGHRLLRFLAILLAVRLLRGALESADPGLAKLALSVVPPRSDPAVKSLPISWADLLLASAEPLPAIPEENP